MSADEMATIASEFEKLLLTLKYTSHGRIVETQKRLVVKALFALANRVKAI